MERITLIDYLNKYNVSMSELAHDLHVSITTMHRTVHELRPVSRPVQKIIQDYFKPKGIEIIFCCKTSYNKIVGTLTLNQIIKIAEKYKGVCDKCPLYNVKYINCYKFCEGTDTFKYDVKKEFSKGIKGGK